MIKQIEILIKKRIKLLKVNKERINDLIAEEYDSQPHDHPFTLTEKNIIKKQILKYKLRNIVINDLRDEGIIPPH